jgi:predicted DNA-binding transcriptional regulator AlpA
LGRIIVKRELIQMTSQSSPTGGGAAQKPAAPTFVLLTAKETATRLKVSASWLAKARMRGDGPPYIKVGRSIRYTEAGLGQWTKSRQRLSTSEQ